MEILSFTTSEVDLILMDGLINVSKRYSTGLPKTLTLTEAITLIPEKFQTNSRLITFMDEDTNIQVWVFQGLVNENDTDWLDESKWQRVNGYDDIIQAIIETQKTQGEQIEEIQQNLGTSLEYLQDTLNGNW